MSATAFRSAFLKISRAFALLLAVCLFGAAGDAWAGDEAPTASEVQIARDLFERGKLKWTQGDFAEAASLFVASQEQVPKAGTVILLADCYEQLGKLRSARDEFQRAAELATGAGDSDLAHRARTREAALLPRIPRLEVRVPSPSPPGLLVTLNGVEVPSDQLNAQVPMDAGQYRLDAHASGYEPFSTSFALTNDPAQPAGVYVAAVTLTPHSPERATSVPTPASRPVKDESGLDQRELAWWIGGAGVAVAVAGGVLMAVTKSKYDSANCDGAGTCASAADARKRNDAVSTAGWATASAIVSALAIGTAVTLYVTAEDESVHPTGAVVKWGTTF
jgi:hypothetical protein